MVQVRVLNLGPFEHPCLFLKVTEALRKKQVDSVAPHSLYGSVEFCGLRFSATRYDAYFPDLSVLWFSSDTAFPNNIFDNEWDEDLTGVLIKFVNVWKQFIFQITEYMKIFNED